MMEYKERYSFSKFQSSKKSEKYQKIRPAIIVSDTQLNEILDLVSVVALTTNLIDDAEPLKSSNSQKENLKEDSDAMIEQLRVYQKKNW